MQITMTKLSNSVLGSLADQTISISKKVSNKVVENNPLLNTLEAEFGNFIAVFGKQSYSGMGSSVEIATRIKRIEQIKTDKTLLNTDYF